MLPGVRMNCPAISPPAPLSSPGGGGDEEKRGCEGDCEFRWVYGFLRWVIRLGFSAFSELRQHTGDDAVAARSGERERVSVGEVDFLRERLAQQAARSEEARAHGRLRDA